MWYKRRDPWLKILYALLAAIVLETIRVRYNRIKDRYTDEKIVQKKRRRFLLIAGFLYSIFLLVPILRYMAAAVEDITRAWPSMSFLRSAVSFGVITAVIVILLTKVLSILLLKYINTMNAARDFFRTIGRNLWTGMKLPTRGVRAAAERVSKLVKPTKEEKQTEEAHTKDQA